MRVRSDQVQVGTLRISYLEAGHGQPLVLLQGFVGDGLATWRHQLEGLSDEFRVVAWDAPGAGRSSDPPESFSLADYADCLGAFLDALGLDGPHLVGLSFGGALALELYRRHPSVPVSLVLAGAYAGWTGSLPAEVVAERLAQSLDCSQLTPELFAHAMTPTMFSSSAARDAVDGFRRAVAAYHPSGFRTMARALAEADLREVLPRVAVPTLLLYGDEDLRAPLAVGEAIRDAVPGARLVVLPGVGHVSSVEAPEEFNNEIRSFLRHSQL
jgi:pimeloyl-ACP methyl ester carboxylesterase